MRKQQIDHGGNCDDYFGNQAKFADKYPDTMLDKALAEDHYTKLLQA